MADSDVTRTKVAVDLLGGDGAPESVAAGVIRALRRDPALQISLVGPERLCGAVTDGATDVAQRVTVVPADQVVAMGEDPISGVRAKRDATVCVTAQLVRDGSADAMVSVGSTGASMAAGIFTLELLPGLTRAALAVILPAAAGPVVLLDVGANVAPSAGLLAQHALAGAAYAQVRLGISDPRVGLLSIGEEAGKGDLTRRAAGSLLAALPVRFIGNVEGDDVLAGAMADVVVTDGFTGNVLLKGMEGAYALLGDLVTGQLARSHPAALVSVRRSTAHLHPDRLAGALLLGVDGVVVVGHGASSAAAVAGCIEQAAGLVRRSVLPQLREALASLIARGATAMLAEAAP